MKAAEPINDQRATEAMIALRYWARATKYTVTGEESAVLTACEERSVQLWKAGIAFGGASGFGLALAMRTGVVQRMAVAGAGASFGSMVGQYKANAPCLENLLALDKRSDDLDAVPPSPLASMAKKILRDGGALTIRNLQQDRSGAVPQGSGPNVRDASAPRQSRGGDAPSMPQEERPPLVEPRAGGGDEQDPFATTAARPPVAASATGDSWEAVRQRHRARAAGDDPSDASHGARLKPLAADSEPDPSRPRRVRRNQYGDEIIE